MSTAVELQFAEEPRAKMIEEHMGFVVACARRYANHGVPLSDLIQEATIGLIKAAERFDPSYGCRFSTYAAWWVKQALWRAIGDFSGAIRVPSRMLSTSRKVRAAVQRLSQEIGREPLFEEIVAYTQLEPAQVRRVMELSLKSVSLTAPLGDDDSSSLVDLLQDPSAVCPQSAAISSDLRVLLHRALDTLSEDEQRVVRLRYGIDGDVGMTTEEVAEACNVKPDAIRHLETKALRKLRKELHRTARDTFPAPATTWV